MSSPPRRHRPLSAFERQAVVGRAISRREASEQTAAILAGLPRCEHGEYAAICLQCHAQRQEEVPF